ncbi:hypothetical protein D9756_000701 [Leucocoprinus leucothites]|uniref:Uncharacterized protein n=1 Tax=Leucocoprinus leucothites TaxID=201217 RepID=A0A8H5LNK4_9AGAR|nr:hypothetical protein D9756_000701 [Leucoagaricus leucothites]
MATVLDAPSALGTYMLKGWVLTDRPCPTSGCRIPLLRSPAGQDPVVNFCVNCDRGSDASRPTTTSGVPQADASTPPSTSSASHLTRASTPATEVSDASDDLPLFVESEETRRRREKTDRASAEIGRRLLQGWTMLGDECPRDECYYTPLVRPPRTNGQTDPKKECVLCGSIYAAEKDWAGRETLVLVNAGPVPQTATPPSHARVPTNPSPVISSVSLAFQPVDALPPKPAAVNQPERSTLEMKIPVSSIMGTLNASSEALQLALQTLTARLTSLASNPTLADSANIATAADAIAKVTQALSQVKQLQWSEIQAHTMT